MLQNKEIGTSLNFSVSWKIVNWNWQFKSDGCFRLFCFYWYERIQLLSALFLYRYRIDWKQCRLYQFLVFHLSYVTIIFVVTTQCLDSATLLRHCIFTVTISPLRHWWLCPVFNTSHLSVGHILLGLCFYIYQIVYYYFCALFVSW